MNKRIFAGITALLLLVAFCAGAEEPETDLSKLNGKQIGQPKGAKLTTKKSIEAKEVILKRSKDFNGDLSDLEVMKLTGVARGTYYKYKRELKSERG